MQAKFTEKERVLLRQTLFANRPEYTEVEIINEDVSGWWNVREVKNPAVTHKVPPGTLTRKMYNS